MNRQLLAEAFFDSLSIAHKLDNFLDGFEENEIHLFSYFSAILFNYVGNPADDWRYRFVISKDGFPHSKDINEAVKRNELNGYFVEKENYMIITGRGTDQYNKLSKNFPTYIKRERYIDAACSTSVLIPYKETKKALLSDPNLLETAELKNQDWISFNYDKLKEITTEIGAPVDELLIPAVSWIEYLLKNSELEDNQ